MINYKLLTGIVLSLFAVTVNAQSIQDVLRYSQPQYTGTARSMAMGGAFGALGGDYSAIGINPAGIAVYRSSEFSFTPSLILNSTESQFANTSTTDNKTTFAINQVGYVGTFRPMREVTKGVVSTHFAIGYNRNNNFNYKSMATGMGLVNSMTDMFRINAYGLDPKNYESNSPQSWDPYNQLTGLAYGAYLIDKDGLDDENNQVYSSFLNDGDIVNQTKMIERNGYSGDINISTGINVSNLLLLGASLNIHSLNYEENTHYYEQFSDKNPNNPLTFKNFEVHDQLDVSGKGISLKLGLIIKPIKNLRLGAAYHTPTWYNIEEDYKSTINVDFFNIVEEAGNDKTGKSFWGDYDYKLNTPGKLIGSIAYVIGKKAIVSFDYENINYSNSKFKSNYSSFENIEAMKNQNSSIKKHLTQSNNYRAGIEYRITNSFSIRGGYSLQESPYKEEPKDFKITGYSGGFGYRNKNYFVDIAYKLTNYDYNYQNYNWDKVHNDNLQAPANTEVSTSNHYATLTMGWKF